MTDTEVELHIENMRQVFGYLPNPHHHPRIFEHMMKVYTYTILKKKFKKS
jgi:hypothetical protein